MMQAGFHSTFYRAETADRAEHARMNGAGSAHANGEERKPSPLGIFSAADDLGPIPPRGWLLGTTFCRRFVSSIVAGGGVGKTALRVAQMLSLASGRALTGEHVFKRCRVLIVCLEDDIDELRRRVEAAMLHHGVSRNEVDGWLFLSAPSGAAGKLMQTDAKGAVLPGTLGEELAEAIEELGLDVVMLDPLVKAHGCEENANNAMDAVITALAGLSVRHDISIDAPHHVSKGTSDPGNADRGRGASAVKDGARLVYTLSTMSSDEAEQFGVPERDRRSYVRMDPGKVNITPSATDATWFRIVGVHLGNGNADYPTGDTVQTVERWEPPETWAGITCALANRILDTIDAGPPEGGRYSNASKTSPSRAAWSAVKRHVPEKAEKQCREIVNSWLKLGVLEVRDFHNEATRKDVKGLFVVPEKRPGPVS